MRKESFYEGLRQGSPEEANVQNTLERSVALVLPDPENLEALMGERRIKLYLGIDPTSPDLHLGHTVPLRKLRQFQDLGHEVYLLFGTFTGMIGDPTDKSSARVSLIREQVDENVATYVDQAARVLDLSENAENPVSVVYNHEWLGKLSFRDVVELASHFSVQQMEKRSMFVKRRKREEPIWLHEFLYPLMQGYDAVAMGVDLEVGGSDQTFNMMIGRDLVREYLDKEKWVMALKLIEDPGGKKMGKTEGNIVNVNDWPEWKYEAVMSWPDAAIPLGFELLTSVPLEQVRLLQELLESGRVSPMDLKRALAFRVTCELDGLERAIYAEIEYERVKRHKQMPKRVKVFQISEPRMSLPEVLVLSGLAKNEVEARNRIAQRAVFVDGKRAKMTQSLEDGAIVQIGKKTIKNIREIRRG